jgi:hypothetical protein
MTEVGLGGRVVGSDLHPVKETVSRAAAMIVKV